MQSYWATEVFCLDQGCTNPVYDTHNKYIDFICSTVKTEYGPVLGPVLGSHGTVIEEPQLKHDAWEIGLLLLGGWIQCIKGVPGA